MRLLWLLFDLLVLLLMFIRRRIRRARGRMLKRNFDSIAWLASNAFPRNLSSGFIG